MPVYTCPECETKINRKQPVEAGKRLRCPECSTVFAVKEKPAAAPKPVPAKAPAPAAPDSDEDGPMNYGLAQDTDTKANQEERDRAYAPLRERFAKSKRGPALQEVVKPSDWLLRSGVGVCISAVVGLLFAIWPMIFKQEEVQAKKTGAAAFYDTSKTKTRFQELSPEEFRVRTVWAIAMVFEFMWGSVICLGASKMHTLENYWLAMLGSIMAIVNPLTGPGVYLLWDNLSSDNPDQTYTMYSIVFLMVGVLLSAWCIATLCKKKVREGFADDSPIV